MHAASKHRGPIWMSSLVLDDFDQPWQEIQRTSEIAARLSLEHDISLSLIPMRERTLRAGASPLARNILREGVVVRGD